MKRAVDPTRVRVGDHVHCRFGKGATWQIIGMTDLITPYPGGAVTRRLRLRSLASGRTRVEYAWSCLPADPITKRQ